MDATKAGALILRDDIEDLRLAPVEAMTLVQFCGPMIHAATSDAAVSLL